MRMWDYPKKVRINEVGPREGVQFEKSFIPTEKKIQLIDALSGTGLPCIEVTSFVSPKWVPQMADAEEVSRGFKPVPGVQYTALFLNVKGLERAAAIGRYELEGLLPVIASDTFSQKNTNKTIQETLAGLGEWIRKYEELKIPVLGGNISAAFGCNYEGDVPPDKVVGLAAEIERVLKEHGYSLQHLTVADTMGWANPRQIQTMIGKLKERWPNLHIRLHLHNTRGPGPANVLAALQMGVSDFDASVGELGGCPFGGHKAAAGNICTEDVVFMCHEMGIPTGIDLDRLIECANQAESIFGHELRGKAMKAGSLQKYRRPAAGAPSA
ncbi:MAG TPA: hydroxymethylglutaryl-CoA lyase [Candidatus Methylomirabilis sp.]|nr:hydroxymethylglutaryl-CoA lyase [Candidatus Methylomirabilis sp.]HSC70054.1 hydroxymethylglutaryl-CoA lyase [Candidatus Methylomirabilis sp.]